MHLNIFYYRKSKHYSTLRKIKFLPKFLKLFKSLQKLICVVTDRLSFIKPSSENSGQRQNRKQRFGNQLQLNPKDYMGSLRKCLRDKEAKS